MNEIYPAAKLGNQILIINKADLTHMGKERGLEVMCIKVDFKNREIDPATELEKHLKFNPWEEMNDDERSIILQILNTKFSDSDILEKIALPLAKNLIK